MSVSEHFRLLLKNCESSIRESLAAGDTPSDLTYKELLLVNNKSGISDLQRSISDKIGIPRALCWPSIDPGMDCILVKDMLTIPGLVRDGLKPDQTDPPDHPLTMLHCNSPAFADSYLSGLTLVYGKAPTLVSKLMSSTVLPIAGPPPLGIVQCLTTWLQASRSHPKSHHSNAAWTCMDWSAILHRFKAHPFNQPLITQWLACSPPAPITLAWWSIFSPTSDEHYSDVCENKSENMKATVHHMSQLHQELLQCMLETGSSGHRHGSGSGGSTGHAFTSWYLPCLRKLERTKEFIYLDALLQHAVHLFTTNTTDTFDEPGGEEGTGNDDKFIILVRLAEFLHLAWSSGRIRNINPEEFWQWLSPLAGYRLFDVMRSRLKR